MEILRLTGAAIEPLLPRLGSGAVELQDERPTQDDFRLPQDSLQFPLTTGDLLTNQDHSPDTSSHQTDLTLSPLTILAEEGSPGKMWRRGREGEEEQEDSCSSSPSVLTITAADCRGQSTPLQSPTTTPTLDTPGVITPLQSGSSTSVLQAPGHVKIRISAKKLREVPSPLLNPPSRPSPRGEFDNLSITSGKHSSISEDCPTEQQPPPLLPKSSLPSPSSSSMTPSSPPLPTPPHKQLDPPSTTTLNHDTHNEGMDSMEKEQTKTLAQGTKTSTTIHNYLTGGASPDSSIIVSQIESPRPTSAAREALLERQRERKEEQKKKVHFKVVQPYEKTNFGENEKKMVHKASPKPTKKVERVGGQEKGRNARIPKLTSRARRRQAGAGADVTRFPVHSLPLCPPPPRHLKPSQVPGTPTSNAFLLNPSQGKVSFSHSTKTSETRGHTGYVNGHTTNAKKSSLQLRDDELRTQISYDKFISGISKSVPSTSPSISPSHSSPPFPPPPPPPLPAPPPPSLCAQCGQLGYEETIRLVATCAAAATAAAMTTQQCSKDEANTVKDKDPGNHHTLHFTSKPSSQLNFRTRHDMERRGGAGEGEEGGGGEMGREGRRGEGGGGGLGREGRRGAREEGRGGRGKSGGEGGEGTRGERLEVGKLPGTKDPSMEKKTEEFTMAPLTSQSSGGVGLEHKQQFLLSNQTLWTGKHSEKTQNGFDVCEQLWGSFPADSNSDSMSPPSSIVDHPTQQELQEDEPIAGTLSDHTEGAPFPPYLQQVPLNKKPSPCISTEQRDLLRVERRFLDIQQARRDLETRDTLEEIKTRWSDPPPPLPSNDIVAEPRHRAAALINQLQTRTFTEWEEDKEKEEEEEERPHSLKHEQWRRRNPQRGELRQIQQSHCGSKDSSNKATKGDKRGRGGPPDPPERKSKGNVQSGTSRTAKWKGNEPKKETTHNSTTITTASRKKTHFSDASSHLDLPQSGGGQGGEDRATQRTDSGSGPAVVVPYHLGESVGMMMMCDPTTGVPLVAPQMVVPVPPYIRMPTSIPLGHTPYPTFSSSSSSSSSSSTVADPNTEPLLPPAPPSSSPTTLPTVAEIGLQTSFTDRSIRNSPPRQAPKKPFKKEEEESRGGISSSSLLAGEPTTAASSSPSGAGVECPTDRPLSLLPPHLRLTHHQHTLWERLSADEINTKAKERLETEEMEWVTRELLTRVMAARNHQSHDVSCDQDSKDEEVARSPSPSCSTCSPPGDHLCLLTTVPPPHQDITTRGFDVVGEEKWTAGGGGGGGGGRKPVECLDDRLVERVVREILKEKVAEILKDSRSQREEGEDKNNDNRSDEETVCSEEDEQGLDSTNTTPRILTPSPSPPLTPPPPRPLTPAPSHENAILSPSISELATPTATPPVSRKSESLPQQNVSTPRESEDELSGRNCSTSDSERDNLLPPLLVTPTPTTPSSPPHRTPTTTLSPPSLTELEDSTSPPPPLPPLPPPPPPPPKNMFDLSDTPSSSSSTSTSSSTATEERPATTSTTITSLTTDREISNGECIIQKPPLPDVSLSEGEVALSPGDARWYSTYATKIGRWTSAGAGGTKTHLKKLSPVVAAFLDLKSSPESISETSDHSTSIDPSEGEVRVRRRQKTGSGKDNPLDQFLANLRSSPASSSIPSSSFSSSSSSTPLATSSRNNTISELPSPARGSDSHNSNRGGTSQIASAGEVREKKEKKRSSLKPLRPSDEEGRREKGGVEKTSLSIGQTAGSRLPYHRKFPLEDAQSASPGEVRAHSSKKRGEVKDLSPMDHSVGEIHPALQELRRDKEKKIIRKSIGVAAEAASSPGEVKVQLNTRNKTRDGIDIIRISKCSPSLPDTDSRRQDTPPSLSFPSSLTDSPLHDEPHQTATPPGGRRRRLRVTSELEPTHSLTISLSPTSPPTPPKNEVREDANTKLSRYDDKKKEETEITIVMVKPLEEEEEVVEEEEEVVEETSPDPPLETLISSSSSSSSFSEDQPATGDGGHSPRPFWDPKPAHQHNTSPIPLPPPPGHPPPSPTPKATGEQTRPRTQLNVSIPTAMEQELDPVSPTYSSDFDFSSIISQPTFD